MSKFKQYEVIYSVWDTRSYIVIADDTDYAIGEAEIQLLDELPSGMAYELLDIIESDVERTEEE